MEANRKKMKLLLLMKMLRDETDPEQGLTMAQIIEKLAEEGISAERKSIYRDIEVLREFGFDIRTYQRAPLEYALGKREFELPELLLMVDAVQSSRFLTQSKSDALVHNITKLASTRQQKTLDKRLHVKGRIKMQNESIYYSVDRIQEAIAERKKISFHYFKYNAKKQKIMQRDDRSYIETPVQLVYSDGYYYLVAYNERHDAFPHYRVDRMDRIRILKEPACRNTAIATFNVEELESSSFGMYGGESVMATFLVTDEAMGAAIDRFGDDLKSVVSAEGQAHVYARVVKSPSFFGWLAQFENRILIEKPASLVQEYRVFLENILKGY